MTEQAFIAQESEKCRKRLLRMLSKVDRTGWAGRETIETLLVNRFIEFGGPSEKNAYNHYRLTDLGTRVQNGENL